MPYTIDDARFYVHDLELLHASGVWLPVAFEPSAFQSERLALLDFEDGCGPDGTTETHTSLSGQVAAEDDDFTAVRFTLGVPLEHNFVNLATAAPPLDVTGMFWTWLYGYKFLKVDGSSPAEDANVPFFLHVGASGCSGDNPQAPPNGECSQPNLARHELSGFSLERRIVADLGRLLATTDLTFNTEGTGPGCMSEPDDPECLSLLPRLGVDDAGEQRLFSVE